MSRDFVDSLPDHIKDIYKNARVNPNAFKMGMLERKKAEDVKDAARNTSALYKIFGENLFTMLTIHGDLNLEITTVEPLELINELNKELKVAVTREHFLRLNEYHIAQNGYPPIMVKHQGMEVELKYKDPIDEIMPQFVDLNKAIERINELKVVNPIIVEVDENDEVQNVTRRSPVVYLNLEDRKDIKGIRMMLQDIQNQTLSVHNMMYLRHSLVMKPLMRSMRAIYWPRDLRGLV